jgi:tetratricopeptide (TPR) repeat protein
MLAACLFAAPAPLLASGVTIGSSNGRMCFEAADSPRSPRAEDFDRCTLALAGAPTREERVATYVNRGLLHLRRGDLDEALADFDQALTIDPRQPEALLNKGAVAVRREDMSSAIQWFNAAIEHRTRRPHLAYYGRAMAHEGLGNVRQAYADYRRASQAAPDWAAPQRDLRRFRVAGR